MAGVLGETDLWENDKKPPLSEDWLYSVQPGLPFSPKPAIERQTWGRFRNQSQPAGRWNVDRLGSPVSTGQAAIAGQNDG